MSDGMLVGAAILLVGVIVGYIGGRFDEYSAWIEGRRR